MDSIKDHNFKGNHLATALYSGFVAPAFVVRSDNHGNSQVGSEILCKNNQIVDLSWSEIRRDSVRINDAKELISGTDNEFSLGDLPSPLNTRCEHAAKTKGL
jgi:hypothetical protein